MRLLLTMNIPYFPLRGGADRGNRRLAEELVGRGHEVEVVVPALTTPPRLDRVQLHAQLAAQGVAVAGDRGVDRFAIHGVAVHALLDSSGLRAYLQEKIRREAPDWILVSSEDPSQNLLDAALSAAPGRVVYLVQTPAFLPFGPHAFFPSRARAELLGRAAAIVGMSRFVASYIRRFGGFDAEAIYWPAYGAPPFPRFGDAGRGFVTLINPCVIKGLPILLELARALPEVPFAAVPTWGTTSADRAALAALPNLTILAPQEDFDRILALARVVLMPSLIAEGFGHTVVEAMLRGIPVLASDAGALPEAKLGTDYVIPVAAIDRFTDELDENLIPVPVVPRQDIGPWRDTLTQLLGDRELYDRQSAASREAALAFASGLGAGPFEDLLVRLEGERGGGGATAAAAVAASGGRPAEGWSDVLAARVSALTPEQRALLILRLHRRREEAAQPPRDAGEPPLTRVPRDAPLPLSFAQQRLWFVEQLRPGTAAYNISGGVVLEGRLATSAFAAGLRQVVARHESLRTVFAAAAGLPHQVILPPAEDVLGEVDLTALPPVRRQREADALVARHSRQVFDLAQGPLFQALLLRLEPERHLFLLVLHHIVADGWSLRLIIDELAALYRAAREGREAALPELPVQYADFAVWQRRRLAGDGLASQLDFWRRQLAGSSVALSLPTRRLRPARSGRAGRVPLGGPLSLLAELRRLSRDARTTLFVTLLSAWKVLLHRYSVRDDVVVGTNVANRNHQQIEGLVGFFVNNLVLRTDLSGSPTFAAAIERVRRVVLDAQAHQEVPFERLVLEMAPPGERGSSPLFRVLVIFDDPAAAPLPEIPGLVLRPLAVASGDAKFDLMLSLNATAEGLRGELEYDLGLYDDETVREMSADYLELLADAARRPYAPIDTLAPGIQPPGEAVVADFNADLEAR